MAKLRRHGCSTNLQTKRFGVYCSKMFSVLHGRILDPLGLNFILFCGIEEASIDTSTTRFLDENFGTLPF